MLVGDGVTTEHDPHTGSDGPLGHLGVRTAAQPEGVVEEGSDAVGDRRGEEEAARRGVVEGRARRVAEPGEERLVDPPGVARLEPRLHHSVDHVRLVLGQRLHHRGQPVRLDGHVVVDEGDEVTRARRPHGAVAGRRDPGPGLAGVADAERADGGGDDGEGRAVGVVVDDEHANRASRRDLEVLERPEQPGQGFPTAIGDHAHGHVPERAGPSHAGAAASGRSAARRRTRSTATAVHSETASTTSAQ